jgi:Flp pilus assembly protein TadD/2-polyprenyl-3-methyl-5-hydroxy-6-metoxy-1,4-benzoquinol methylase
MNRKQRRAAPKSGPTSLAQAAAASKQGDALFQSAVQLHRAGRLREAEMLYRDALALSPSHVGALTHFGVLYHQAGQSVAAIDLIKRAIAADRQDAEPRYSLGLVYASLGQDSEAIAQNRKALKLNPDYADAHTNLGILLLRQSQTREATQHLTQALALKPSQPAYENLANALLEDGRPLDALDIALAALQSGAGRNLKSTFVMIARSLDPLQALQHKGFRDSLVHALREPWGRPRDLSRQVAAILMQTPAIATSVQRVTANTTASDIIEHADTLALASDPLLLALMQTAPVVSLELERLLTGLRRALLDSFASDPNRVPHALLPFAATLARQCFINEYVFDVEDDEARQAAALHGMLSARVDAGEPIDPTLVALGACYAPLHTIAGADRLAAREWPEPIRDLIVQQVRDHQTEQRLRATIPALTPIADATSEKVRQQYEENPYPRWTKTVPDQQPLGVDQYIHTRFPASRYRNLGNGPLNLLMAGCGTGMHTIERSLLFRPAHTLAIDLSLSSLSYAARKATEAGLSNIEFAQADILAARSIGRTFEMIDASGVLHHLRDPFEGWRNLAALLKPDGVMHVALYSATARQEIRALREIAAARGYGHTVDAVRALRKDIVNLDPADPLRRVTDFTDFYSTSECRDLLMHVQEHQLSIPEIAAFLDEERFEFLGFETSAGARYRNRFPDDPTATNLSNWARFEAENPSTFTEMYQFWIQKRQG